MRYFVSLLIFFILVVSGVLISAAVRPDGPFFVLAAEERMAPLRVLYEDIPPAAPVFTPPENDRESSLSVGVKIMAAGAAAFGFVFIILGLSRGKRK